MKYFVTDDERENTNYHEFQKGALGQRNIFGKMIPLTLVMMFFAN